MERALEELVWERAGPDFEATFSAPEDVIIKKLEYFREGGSEWAVQCQISLGPVAQN